MNKEQGRAERDYRLVKAVFMTLRDKGIVTDEELSALKKECVRRDKRNETIQINHLPLSNYYKGNL